MTRGEWYKTFTASEKTNEDQETYFHIVEIDDDETVLIDEYIYYKIMRKLIKQTKNPYSYSLKQWLEQIIQNNVYLVDKEKLPFLLHF